ncbi:hypothetical protein ENUP19_0353G0033 [Entamoeba nuttalli]|uniref:LMBR1 family region protein n=1 Tax=Entamoeba nuttalli TaxID=412467 RepID=A0ABQ0DY88_9EUKA
MINIIVIILLCAIPILLLICNIYMMIYFQNPEEKGVSWIWRIIIIIAFEFLEMSVFLIPLDVLNAGPPEPIIPMQIFWYIVYYGMIVFAAIILPFGLCWYNQEEDTSCVKKIVYSFIFALIFLVVAAVFCVIFYIIFGVAEVPVNYQSGDLDLTSFNLDNIKAANVRPENDDEESTISFRISPVLFLISGISTIGYVLVLFFGGLGFAVLPIDLIFDFINRPEPLKSAQIKEYNKLIGERALAMIDEGKEIKQLTGRKYRKRYSQFREEVYILDRGLKVLNKRRNLKGFLWGYVAIILGIIATLLTLLWMVQLVLWTILKIFPFVDWIMQWMTGPISFFGAIIYGIFAGYLLLCSFKAVVYVGFRFALGFVFYPFEVSNTYMNAFCFNGILLVLIAFGVNQFSSETFSNFLTGSSFHSFMGEAITQLRYVKYVYKYAPFVMPILCVLMLVFMLLSKLLCKNKKEKDALDILLEYENIKPTN